MKKYPQNTIRRKHNNKRKNRTLRKKMNNKKHNNNNNKTKKGGLSIARRGLSTARRALNSIVGSVRSSSTIVPINHDNNSDDNNSDDNNINFYKYKYLIFLFEKIYYLSIIFHTLTLNGMLENNNNANQERTIIYYKQLYSNTLYIIVHIIKTMKFKETETKYRDSIFEILNNQQPFYLKGINYINKIINEIDTFLFTRIKNIFTNNTQYKDDDIEALDGLEQILEHSKDINIEETDRNECDDLIYSFLNEDNTQYNIIINWNEVKELRKIKIDLDQYQLTL